MARSVSHWTTRYVADRVREKLWIRLHPRSPWLTPAAVGLIASLLRPTDRVFEWGSGRSTRWFAARAASVTSIETDPVWHERVSKAIAGIPHAECVLIEAGIDADEAVVDRYCSALADRDPAGIDVALVDGLFRDRCALTALAHLAPGGVLIVDDVQRYLPSASRSPSAVADHASAAWRAFAAGVAGWDHRWVGSGVTDTAIWIRPGGDRRLPA